MSVVPFHRRLTANYAPYPDGNVPRQGLYFSYRRVCDQYGIPHINTATLGKAIRLCFPTIKTRRLGVRGNSKYHCESLNALFSINIICQSPDHPSSPLLFRTDCGIRPATSTEAEFLQDYIRKSNNNAAQQSVNAARVASDQADTGNRGSDEDEDEESDGPSSANASKRNSLNLSSGGPKQAVVFADEKTPTAATLLSQAQATQRPSSSSFPSQAPIRRHPGPADPPMAVPSQPSADGGVSVAMMTALSVMSVRQMVHFPNIEEAVGVNSTSPQGIAAREVWTWFSDHLDALLESMRGFRFDQFEMHVRTFWSSLNGAHREVVHAPAVAGLMAKADAIVYDVGLVSVPLCVLVPDPWRLATVGNPGVLTITNAFTAISSYTRRPSTTGGQDGENTTRGTGQLWQHFCRTEGGTWGTLWPPRLCVLRRFCYHLFLFNELLFLFVVRFLDMYQVTQALSTVLTNPKQLVEMKKSWQKIDFDSVRNQSALVCNCRHEELSHLLEVEFVGLLDSMTKSTEPVRDVMAWADKCCDKLMGGRGNEERATMSSRSVLIRWGYVTSQVMRDLVSTIFASSRVRI